MAKVIVIQESTTGDTKRLSEAAVEGLKKGKNDAEVMVKVKEVTEANVNELTDYDLNLIVLESPTLGGHELKDDLMDFSDKMGRVPLTRKKIAVQNRFNMEVFSHYLYEYKKGLRNLILYTEKIQEKDRIEKRLKKECIDYFIQRINGGARMNVFFGDSVCVEIIRQMKFKSLSHITEEQDFILGTMLGYDRLKQCERYLKRKWKKNKDGQP